MRWEVEDRHEKLGIVSQAVYRSVCHRLIIVSLVPGGLHVSFHDLARWLGVSELIIKLPGNGTM